jgi:hypothetical protein
MLYQPFVLNIMEHDQLLPFHYCTRGWTLLQIANMLMDISYRPDWWGAVERFFHCSKYLHFGPSRVPVAQELKKRAHVDKHDAIELLDEDDSPASSKDDLSRLEVRAAGAAARNGAGKAAAGSKRKGLSPQDAQNEASSSSNDDEVLLMLKEDFRAGRADEANLDALMRYNAELLRLGKIAENARGLLKHLDQGGDDYKEQLGIALQAGRDIKALAPPPRIEVGDRGADNGENAAPAKMAVGGIARANAAASALVAVAGAQKKDDKAVVKKADAAAVKAAKAIVIATVPAAAAAAASASTAQLSLEPTAQKRKQPYEQENEADAVDGRSSKRSVKAPARFGDDDE